MPSWKVDLSERRSIRAQVTWLSKSPCRSDGFIGTTHRQSDWLTDWILFDSIRSRVVERIFGRARCHWVVYRVAAPHKRATLLIDGPNIIIRFKWLHALLTAVRDSNGGVSRSSNAEMILLPLYWYPSIGRLPNMHSIHIYFLSFHIFVAVVAVVSVTSYKPGIGTKINLARFR